MRHRNRRPRAHALRLDASTVGEPALAFVLAMLVSWMISVI